MSNQSSPRLVELGASVKRLWVNCLNVPGFPLKTRRRRAVYGSVGFWIVYGLAMYCWYLLVFGYWVLVVSLKVSWALLASAVWLVAYSTEATTRRRVARSATFHVKQ